jgi:uncharacterized protein involved in exopolysaccharide biosynthesis
MQRNCSNTDTNANTSTNAKSNDYRSEKKPSKTPTAAIAKTLSNPTRSRLRIRRTAIHTGSSR